MERPRSSVRPARSGGGAVEPEALTPASRIRPFYANAQDATAQDATLAQWKRERLAHHHAYFALLDRSFTRWKQVALARRRRRQSVIAACRVGARFFQRLYWDQWLASVARNRAARARATLLLEMVYNKTTLRTSLARWKGRMLEAQRQRQAARKMLALADRKKTEYCLQVRGVGLSVAVPTLTNSNHALGATNIVLEALPEVDHDGQSSISQTRAASVQRIVVYHTQRQYFQLWKNAAHAVDKMIAAQLRIKADSFRLNATWRRWHRGYVSRTQHTSASRQAIFFLYYHLTKKSLSQLQRHAKSRRREHEIVMVVATCVRRRRIHASLSMWRQRLDTKVVFSQWREVVTDTARHDRDPQLQLIREIVSNVEKKRLLHHFFVTWLQQFTRRRRAQAIVRLVQVPLTKVAVTQAFQRWRQHTGIRKKLEAVVGTRNREQLVRVWSAWSNFTSERVRQEMQRRMATRFWYYRTLRRTLSALQALRARRNESERQITHREHERTFKLMKNVVQSWSRWSIQKRRLQEQSIRANNHRQFGIKRRAFDKMCTFYQRAKEQDAVAIRHIDRTAGKTLRRAFDTWRRHRDSEISRNEALSSRLHSYAHTRDGKAKRRFFNALNEYAKSRITTRLRNAHARGRFQAHLLRTSLSTWVAAVAQLKWEHIFDERARQFRRQRLQRMFVQLWRLNAQARRDYRESTRKALHHWKKVREREAFRGWKQYLMAKRHQRDRLHAALEFRHRAHIRDGLSQWVVGATYLGQLRNRRTAETQSVHTARVWRKVREVALHWRWITQQKRYLSSSHRRDRGTVSRLHHVPNALDDDHVSRRNERVLAERTFPTRPLPAASIRRDHHTTELSDFVMLPRTRPRPRKPIDMILDTTTVLNTDNDGREDSATALQHVNHRYGFQFPTVPSRITKPPNNNYDGAHAHNKVSGAVEDSTLGELEQQLHRWYDRRQRLRHLQQALDDFRRLLHRASLEGNLEQHELDEMRARLRAMEQQEASSRQQWRESRPEILSLAQRIKALRGTTSVSA